MMLRLLPLLAIFACGPDDLAPGEEGIVPVDCDRDPPLDYDNFGAAFLQRNCTGCHSSELPEGDRFGAPELVDLDSLGSVDAWAYRIHARTLQQATMPPGGGIPEEDLAMLDEWLQCDVFEEIDP